VSAKPDRTPASVKASLTAFGFVPETGTQGVALSVGDYPLRVSFAGGGARVDYGSGITVERETTLDLLCGTENLVVLECVIRLLRQGYDANALVLEKSFQLGRNKTKGHLDILVNDGNGQAFLMIECKAWDEFDDSPTGEPAGQLVSYLHQDPLVQVGCLYTSRVVGGVVETPRCLALDNALLVKSKVGDKDVAGAILAGRSLFQEPPYAKPQRYLVASNLESLGPDSGGKIFNGFMEILRRYAVSDKPNAFNKIFNLFICKIWDEEKEGNDRLDFQWLPDESAETVLGRLNGLYREGVNQFLHMEVVDHDWQEVLKKLNAVSGKQNDFADIEQMFTDLRLYKNNEFGFYEVYDQKTFRENAEIVRDVVRLLQDWKLRYDHRHPFMGEFFERLLNTSVKQESGQFFTPLPVARFICDALPFEQVIDDKIQAGDTKFLPHMIDYAAGSGHFLTEGMERVDLLLQQRVAAGGLKGKQKTNGKSWSTGYQWASEFVYGIEKDYRLAKTAKISCFLNGDGDANLIRANGLDHFVHSQEYQVAPALSLSADKAKKSGLDNPSFDVVLANPPYSVAQYKQTIPRGAESFELWPFVGDDNDDIECLFLERTKHLLRYGGVAGVIFPSSILNNDGIAARSRGLLLKYFEIVGIVHLGSSTFMAANVSTATLFLRRRDNDHWVQVNALVELFLATGQDYTVDGVEDLFATYAQEIRGLNLSDYVNALRHADKSVAFVETLGKRFKPRKMSKKQALAMTADQLSAQQQSEFVQFIREQEAARLLDFALTRSQSTVFVKAPAGNDEQAAFLGYQFSSRRGQEGLTPVNPNSSGQVDGLLYNETTPHDPNRVSGVLHAAFGGSFVVPPSLSATTQIVNLASLIKFDRADYIAEIGPPTTRRPAPINGRRLSDLADFSYGLWEGKKGPFRKARVLRSTELISNGYGLNCDGGAVLDVEQKQFATRELVSGDIVLERSGGSDTQAVGRVGLYLGPSGVASFNAFLFRVRVKDRVIILPEYLYEVMASIYASGATGKMQKGTSGIRNLDLDEYSNQIISVPSMDEQVFIARRARRLRAVAEGRQRQAESVFQKILAVVPDTANVPLSTLLEVVSDRVKPADSPTAKFNLVEMEQVDAGTGRGKPIQKFGSQINGPRASFKKGDVLYGRLSPGQKKVWAADTDGVCSPELVVLRSSIPAPVIASLLLRDDLAVIAKSLEKGSSQKRISVEDLLAIKAPDPTSNVQQYAITIQNLEAQRVVLESKAMEFSEKRNSFIKSTLGV
jgi:type I restriction enzyme M protein